MKYREIYGRIYTFTEVNFPGSYQPRRSKKWYVGGYSHFSVSRTIWYEV